MKINLIGLLCAALIFLVFLVTGCMEIKNTIQLPAGKDGQPTTVTITSNQNKPVSTTPSATVTARDVEVPLVK